MNFFGGVLTRQRQENGPLGESSFLLVEPTIAKSLWPPNEIRELPVK